MVSMLPGGASWNHSSYVVHARRTGIRSLSEFWPPVGQVTLELVRPPSLGLVKCLPGMISMHFAPPPP